MLYKIKLINNQLQIHGYRCTCMYVLMYYYYMYIHVYVHYMYDHTFNIHDIHIHVQYTYIGALSDLIAVKKNILESTTPQCRSCRLNRVLRSFVRKVAQKMQTRLHFLSVLTWQSVYYSN